MEPMNRMEATPPAIVSAEDLLKKMRSGVKTDFTLKLRDLTIPVRILSIDELTQIRREALKHAALNGGDEAEKNVFIEKTVLKMASNITGGPILSDKLLSMMSVDEVNYLYSEYTKIQDDINPMLEQIRPEQFRALVDGVKKKTLSSKDCSLRQLRAIFTAYQDLIERLENQTSPTDNSSGGQS